MPIIVSSQQSAVSSQQSAVSSQQSAVSSRFLRRVTGAVFRRLTKLYRTIQRYPFKLSLRHKLRNKNFTLIAKDCTGAYLLHELGLRFDTPTVNLYFTAPDFVKFCRRLEHYLSLDVSECTDTEGLIPEKSYPVGSLGTGEDEIHIHFMHYKNFQQAKEKWEERKKRIHWDNMFFIMTDGTGSSPEIAGEFDALPLRHKALLTYRDLPGIKSAIKLDIPNAGENGIGAPHLFGFRSKLSARRVIDDWDYVSFLNS